MNTLEFQEDPPREAVMQEAVMQADDSDQLLLDIDGYEGPIDVLLDLARKQKVDLAKISILQLARQYLEFVERAKAHNLELAAEYLVMASWLAYLKSRLLLPDETTGDEPSAEEMAEALQFQLQRLEAMQKAADQLMERPLLGQQIFGRGEPEGLGRSVNTRWDVGIYDLLRAYGEIRQREDHKEYDLPTFHLMSMDEAVGRLTKMLGRLPKKGMKTIWTTLSSFLPDDLKDSVFARSALASTLTAGLELAKQGKIEMRQDGAFKPVYLRGAGGEE